jgi:hypothetical protein
MTHELDQLATEAWTTPARAKELWKTAKKHPAMARSAWAYDWVRKKGYETEHHIFRNQLEWMAIGLALHGDPRVLPFLVARAGARWDFGRMVLAWLETDRTDGPRLAAAARTWIAGDDTDVHQWKLGARCLAYVGTADDGPLVADRLGACFDAMWSPDVSTTVRMEGHAASLGASLARIGVPRSFVPMLESVVSSEGSSIDRARGTAALLLASLGTGLDPIARGVRFQIDKDQANRVTPGQLLALGTLAKDAPAEMRRGLAAMVRAVDAKRDHDPLHVAAALALADLGESADPVAAATKALAGEPYSWSDQVEQVASTLELVATRPELPVALAVPFVHDDDTRIHRAAYRALKRRGAELPTVRVLDGCTLHHSDPSTLRAALRDPSVVPRSLLVAHFVRHPDPAAAAVLRDGFDDLPRPRHRWDPRRDTRRDWLRALLATGDPSATDVVANALGADEGVLPIDDLPSALARSVATLFLRTKDKNLRAEAKQWLGRRAREPDVVRALAPLGLAPEDFDRSPR